MTPRPTQRAAKLVTHWVRRYTRHLPAPIAERRIGEISADLHDHIAHEQARGTSERRIALSVLSRAWSAACPATPPGEAASDPGDEI